MKKHFTLVELTIVVAALSVLASMTAPTTWRAREEARRTLCNSNIKQSLSAMQMYGQNNDGWVSLYMSGYRSWWQMPGMDIELNLNSATTDLNHPSNRKVTSCPLDFETTNVWANNVCLGVPRWRYETVADYEALGFEHIADNTSPGCYIIRIDMIPEASKYVLLADVVYGPQFYGTDTPQRAGDGCCIFYRRNSNFSAISTRHNGVGNVGYADGHVGDTQNHTTLWTDSKIGSLVSADGATLESFYE